MTENSKPLTFSAKRSCAIILVVGVLLGLSIWQATIPVKEAIAKRYIARGDTYFIELQFDNAETEYREALKYDKTSTLAANREAIAAQAGTNLVQAKPLFQALGQDAVVNEIDTATTAFTDPEQAFTTGVAFYDNAQYALAQYPLQQATTLDPDYPDAWNYLALTYDKLAEQNVSYKTKAQQARAKRDALTTKWIGQ